MNIWSYLVSVPLSVYLASTLNPIHHCPEFISAAFTSFCLPSSAHITGFVSFPYQGGTGLAIS